MHLYFVLGGVVSSISSYGGSLNRLLDQCEHSVHTLILKLYNSRPDYKSHNPDERRIVERENKITIT